MSEVELFGKVGIMVCAPSLLTRNNSTTRIEWTTMRLLAL